MVLPLTLSLSLSLQQTAAWAADILDQLLGQDHIPFLRHMDK